VPSDELGDVVDHGRRGALDGQPGRHDLGRAVGVRGHVGGVIGLDPGGVDRRTAEDHPLRVMGEGGEAQRGPGGGVEHKQPAAGADEVVGVAVAGDPLDRAGLQLDRVAAHGRRVRKLSSCKRTSTAAG
jgi:hypothetical protein